MKKFYLAFLFTFLSTFIFLSHSNGQAFEETIARTLKYPQEARKQNVEGIVSVSLKVDEEGELTSFTVVDSPHELLTEEVNRAFQSIKKSWKPKFVKDKALNQDYLVLLEFLYNPDFPSASELLEIYKGKKESGTKEEALDFLNKSIEMYPYSEPLLMARGEFLRESGELEGSQKDYLRARRLQRQVLTHMVITGYTVK